MAPSRRQLVYVRTTAEGSPGEVFGILGSMGFSRNGHHRGSAFQFLGVGKGSPVNVVMEGR